MAQPRDREIAAKVRAEARHHRVRGTSLAELTKLTERQFHRRLYGQVAFTGAQLEALAVEFGRPRHYFLAAEPDGENAA